jgi:hypothetical protein
LAKSCPAIRADAIDRVAFDKYFEKQPWPY